jgi:hypothetical protein
MTQYSVTILRHVDDETTELVDQYLTADQAIDLMLHIKENFEEMGEGEEEEENEEEEEEPVRQSKTRKAGLRKCGVCGEPGHTSRTCSQNTPARYGLDSADDDRRAPPPVRVNIAEDTRSLREKVKDLWDSGLSLEEVYDALPSEKMVELQAIYNDIDRKHHR